MSIPARLEAIRRRGEPVALEDLARDLLAVQGGLDVELSRRVVAEALGWNDGELPDVLSPDQLRSPETRSVASRAIAEAEFTVVDLETTGLSADRCEILEIGAVRVRGLALVDEYESFVRPSEPIPARITRLTGIRDVMVAEAPDLDAALREFLAWLAPERGAPFVAHNAGFDSRFVRAGLDRCQLGPLGLPVLCTRRLARRLAPEVGRYSLDHLSAHFGRTNRARHRALGDARVTGQILVELLHRAPDHGLATLGDLIDFHEAAPARRR